MNSEFPAISHRDDRYDGVAVFFHWTVAILIIGMIGLGWYMMSIEDEPGSGWYFSLHKSIGITIAVLVVLRLIWRLAHRPKPLPQSVPHWQAVVARIVHWLLYAAMIAMPIAGFSGALFSKDGIAFFGLPIPRLVSPDHAVAETFFMAHGIIAWVLVTLISMHILAGLKHLLINKDGVFQRMWHS